MKMLRTYLVIIINGKYVFFTDVVMENNDLGLGWKAERLGIPNGHTQVAKDSTAGFLSIAASAPFSVGTDSTSPFQSGEMAIQSFQK